MAYYIGIDGGGTKSKCVLCDEEFNVLRTSIGGATNFLVRGIDVVSNTLFTVISNLLNEASIDFSEINGIVLGSTGAGRRSDAEHMENGFNLLLKNKRIDFNKFFVDSDARIALEGAFGGKPGSILIAGTGSIMFGKDKDGKIHRVGGFGRYLGDEGSGYTIGRRGLNVVSKDFDGRNTGTVLTKLLAEQINIKDQAELIFEVYKNNFDIAGVAPLVMEAAEQDDKECLKILDEESNELIEHIFAMKNSLKENILKVALIGGTITTENFYSKLFKKKTEALENISIQKPQYPPEVGAALMASKLW